MWTVIVLTETLHEVLKVEVNQFELMWTVTVLTETQHEVLKVEVNQFEIIWTVTVLKEMPVSHKPCFVVKYQLQLMVSFV